MLNFFRIFSKNTHLERSLQYQITIKSQKQVLFVVKCLLLNIYPSHVSTFHLRKILV